MKQTIEILISVEMVTKRWQVRFFRVKKIDPVLPILHKGNDSLQSCWKTCKLVLISISWNKQERKSVVRFTHRYQIHSNNPNFYIIIFDEKTKYAYCNTSFYRRCIPWIYRFSGVTQYKEMFLPFPPCNRSIVLRFIR